VWNNDTISYYLVSIDDIYKNVTRVCFKHVIQVNLSSFFLWCKYV
jgi:hypothetical protein